MKNNILVTGGSGFLGSELYFSLSDMGAFPVIFDQNEKSLKILKKKFDNRKRKGSFYLVDINNEGKLIKTINCFLKPPNIYGSLEKTNTWIGIK